MANNADRQLGSEALGKFWTVSNVLSLLRIVLALPAAWLIVNRDHPDPGVISLVVLAIATDFFDGKIARWSKTVSDWGKLLDPMADKIGGGFVVIALTVKGLLPLWFLVLFISRDVVIAIVWRYMVNRMQHVYISRWIAKIATGVMALTVLLIILGLDETWTPYFIYASAAMLVISFMYYVFLTLIELKRPPRDAIDNKSTRPIKIVGRSKNPDARAGEPNKSEE